MVLSEFHIFKEQNIDIKDVDVNLLPLQLLFLQYPFTELIL